MNQKKKFMITTIIIITDYIFFHIYEFGLDLLFNSELSNIVNSSVIVTDKVFRFTISFLTWVFIVIQTR